jgi:uncharacterized protein (AIM24 family)
MQWTVGNVSATTGVKGAGDLIGKMIKGAVTKESAVKPEYTGKGYLVLEPTYKYLILQDVEEWGTAGMSVEDGMFLACEGTVNRNVVARKNLSSAVLGGEGLFQIELTGSGVVILECNVPKSEIIECNISRGEELKVDGNFAIARTKGVNFSVTKSDKSLFGSAINGEGLLNTFSGEGTVWIAPTQPMYEKLRYGLPNSNNSMNNQSPRQKG